MSRVVDTHCAALLILCLALEFTGNSLMDILFLDQFLHRSEIRHFLLSMEKR